MRCILLFCNLNKIFRFLPFILCLIQSSAIITRSNITWYCTRHCKTWGRIWIRGWVHKTSHALPYRSSYGMSFVNILQRIDRVIMALHCIMLYSTMIYPESIVPKYSKLHVSIIMWFNRCWSRLHCNGSSKLRDLLKFFCTFKIQRKDLLLYFNS